MRVEKSEKLKDFYNFISSPDVIKETKLRRKKVVLDGLVVSVLATIFKIRGFKPGRQRWIYKGDKNQ
jgi:hypothetical protein